MLQTSEKAGNLDLTLHGDTEECDEVHDQYRPEHWDVETVEECTDDCDCRRLDD